MGATPTELESPIIASISLHQDETDTHIFAGTWIISIGLGMGKQRK